MQVIGDSGARLESAVDFLTARGDQRYACRNAGFDTSERTSDRERERKREREKVVAGVDAVGRQV